MQEHVTMYCDGGLLGKRNPSPEGVHWSVYCEPPSRVVVRGKSERYHTNNEAEWLALMAAFKYALDNHPKADSIRIHSDSRLIVNMFNGVWCPKNTRMMRMRQDCRILAACVESSVEVVWCRRNNVVSRVGH